MTPQFSIFIFDKRGRSFTSCFLRLLVANSTAMNIFSVADVSTFISHWRNGGIFKIDRRVAPEADLLFIGEKMRLKLSRSNRKSLACSFFLDGKLETDRSVFCSCFDIYEHMWSQVFPPTFMISVFFFFYHIFPLHFQHIVAVIAFLCEAWIFVTFGVSSSMQVRLSGKTRKKRKQINYSNHNFVHPSIAK